MDSSLHWKDKTKTNAVIPDLIWNPVWSNNPLMDSSLRWKDKSKTSPLWIPVYTGRTNQNNPLMDSCLHWKDKEKTSLVIPDLIWMESTVGSNNTLMDSSIHWNDKSEMREGQIKNKLCHSRLDLESSVEQQYPYGFQFTLEGQIKTNSVIPDLIWNLLCGATIPLWIPVYTGRTNQNKPCNSRLDLESTV